MSAIARTASDRDRRRTNRANQVRLRLSVRAIISEQRTNRSQNCDQSQPAIISDRNQCRLSSGSKLRTLSANRSLDACERIAGAKPGLIARSKAHSSDLVANNNPLHSFSANACPANDRANGGPRSGANSAHLSTAVAQHGDLSFSVQISHDSLDA